MKRLLTLSALIAAVCAAPGTLLAQSARPAVDVAAAQPAAPHLDIPRAMTPYFIGFAMDGERARPPGTAEHTAIIQRHLAYIRRMIEARKFVVAGPMADSGTVVGMVIIDAATRDEALRLLADDPAVHAGQMRYELRQAMLPSLAAIRVAY